MTKTLVKYTQNIKKNKYEWLKYDKINQMEKDNITEENKHMETNFVKSFVEEIDGLNIEERESIEKEKILIT